MPEEPHRSPAFEPGNILLTVDGRDIIPPEHPVFPMGKQTEMSRLSTTTTSDARLRSTWHGPKGRSSTSSSRRLLKRGSSEMGWAI